MNEEKIKIFCDKYLSMPEELEDRVNNFLKEIQEKDGKVLGVHLTSKENSRLLVVCVRYTENSEEATNVTRIPRL